MHKVNARCPNPLCKKYGIARLLRAQANYHQYKSDWFAISDYSTIFTYWRVDNV